MGEAFFGLNVATRGLFASQRGLSTVNHNLNNVNTPGYSRQQIIQQASTPIQTADTSGMLGSGAEVVGVKRVHDEYLDFKYWSENQSYGEWEKKSTLFSELEATFNEPSDVGFNKIMDDFYSSLQELSKTPDSLSVRALVKEKGISVAKYFNSVATHFEKMQNDMNNEIMLKIDKINSLGNEIAKLNRQIYTQEVTTESANDLRDKRTALVDELSKLTNIEAYEIVTGKLASGKDEKHFIVSISGKTLVNHFDNAELEVVQRETKLNEEDIDKLYDIKWKDGSTAKIKSGELKGLLDVRDGNEGDNGSPNTRGIPYYQKQLNKFVRIFARTFNEGIIDHDGDGSLEDIAGHADGYKLQSESGDDPSGVRFFTMRDEYGEPMDSDTFINPAKTVLDDPASTLTDKIDALDDEYNKITAKNFTISRDIMDDYENSISTSGEAGQVGNTENIASLIKMRHNPYMFIEGAPEDFVKTMVSTIAIDTQQAQVFKGTQKTITHQIENRRTSVSGVSIDEEMSNMVKFQHAYNASAKMISTMNEILNVLVNQLGI